MRKFFRLTAKGFFAVVAMGMTLWSVFAIYYSNLPGHFLRLAAAIIFPVICDVIIVTVKPFRKAILLFLAVFVIVLIWWLLIPPSNNRNWQSDVAILTS